MLFIFICIVGLRYRLGVDSVRYATFFSDLPDIGQLWSYDFSSTRYGLGYLLLASIVRSITDDFTLMQFVLATLVNTVLFTFFYRNTRHIFTCLFFYFFLSFFNYNFEILRESCAVAMFVMGWKYILSQNWIKYYLCALAAFLFHMSGIITLFVPIIFLPWVRNAFRISILTPIIIGILLIIGILVSSFFFDYLRLLEITSVDNYVNIYDGTGYAEGKEMSITRMIGFIVKIVGLPLLLGWMLKRKRILNPISENSKYIKVFESMIVLSLYVSTLAYSIRILGRFNNYFYPFTILLLGDSLFFSIQLLKKKWKLSFGIWCIFIFLYISPNIISWTKDIGDSGIPFYHRYYPYNTIIFKEKDTIREQLFNYEGINRS